MRDLARVSQVGATTVSRFESGKPANPSTLALLRQAFEQAGVRFTDDGGVFPPAKAGDDENVDLRFIGEQLQRVLQELGEVRTE